MVTFALFAVQIIRMRTFIVFGTKTAHFTLIFTATLWDELTISITLIVFAKIQLSPPIIITVHLCHRLMNGIMDLLKDAQRYQSVCIGYRLYPAVIFKRQSHFENCFFCHNIKFLMSHMSQDIRPGRTLPRHHPYRNRRRLSDARSPRSCMSTLMERQAESFPLTLSFA